MTGQGLPGRHLVTLEVPGHPASFSTAATAPWKEAVRAAVAASGIAPVPTARFTVGIDFRTPAPVTANHVWDLDNLIKPTLDALDRGGISSIGRPAFSRCPLWHPALASPCRSRHLSWPLADETGEPEGPVDAVARRLARAQKGLADLKAF